MFLARLRVFRYVGLGLAVAVGLVGTLATSMSAAFAEPIKVGLMLPYSGTYAQYGQHIANGFHLAVEQNGGKIGGADVRILTVDDESAPSKAISNMQRLVSGERVDVVVGTVHSGVAMAMVKVARQTGTILIIPNAGLNVATRQLCAPNVFRTSFSNWQPGYAMGSVAYDRGYRTAVTLAWDYTAGRESVEGFKESFTAAGGKILKEFYVPYPSVDVQAHLTQIADINPDAVFAFIAGGAGVQFIKAYDAAGLKANVQLLGSGYINLGSDILAAQGKAGDGVLTTLQYVDTLDNPENIAFRKAYRERFNEEADLLSVQGYDAGRLLIAGVDKAGGFKDKEALAAAMSEVQLKSPRGPMTFSAAHNPVQNIYLREARDGKQVVLGVAAEALSDPGTGCSMTK